jgi:predicted transglutaminase-like cysteine proteinase
MKTLRAAALAGSILCAAFHSAAANENRATASSLPLPPANGAYFTFPINTKPERLGERLPAYNVFCQHSPAECIDFPRAEKIIHLDQASWDRLVAVFEHVRANMELVEDFRTYGPTGKKDTNGRDIAPDVWTHGETGKGDCEDWALRWRRELMAAGFPASALLLTFLQNNEIETMTVNGVTQTYKQGHLVLAIRTDRGDLVADMLKDQLYSVAELTKEWDVDLVESPFNMTQFFKPDMRKPPQVIQVSGVDKPLQIR